MENIPENAAIIDCSESIVIEWSQEEFSQMLQSIKGIGPALAKKIINAICSKYDISDVVEAAENQLE